jgi:signal transduction histidine kinase
MKWLKAWQPNSWWLANFWIAALLVAIAVAGLIAIGINDNLRDALVGALQYDLEIEDRADDLKVAILDVRHYQRNLVFGGPSPRRLDDYETAYEQLLLSIDELDRLGIEAPNLLTAVEFRQLAEEYHAGFAPAIEFYETDRQAFQLASDDGLWLLAELESEAHRIERFGERAAAAAVQDVEKAATTARALLLVKLAGHILIGLGLAFLIRRTLREQRETAAELAHALQMKTDFIADMSHELRTPLTVLRANAEVALNLEQNCVHTDLLQEIVLESERMTHLVEDLLFLTRSDAGAIPLEWETVSVGNFLTELADRGSILTRQYGADLYVDSVAKAMVRLDRARLAQAVLNLIDNAAKYSPAGATVTLRSRLVDVSNVTLEVADEGPGIPEEHLERIFDRFYRVDKARSRNGGGVGLGLAIAKSIVTAHGGRIEAESTPGRGTVMRVYLPVVTAVQVVRPLAERLVREPV